MFKNLKILSLTVCLAFVVSACDEKSKSKLKHDENMINTSATFDKNKFISQSKEKGDEDYRLGPKVASGVEVEKRKSYRRLINKEENFDYVDISQMEKHKNFDISINAENMDIRTFADMLSEITDVNILVSDEVSGNISGKLNNVTWTSMMDSMLNMKRLAKHIDYKANIIRIHDESTVVQLEEFERKRKENVQRALLLKKASQPLRTEIFKLFYTKPNTIKSTIEGVLISQGSQVEGIRNINPEITVDERQNLIIVKAREEDMGIISKLINELDTRTQQVYIEAFIVEVNDDFDSAFGSRIGLAGTSLFGESGSFSGLAGTGASALALGTADGSTVNLPVTGATSGLGILTGIDNAAELKVELTAMESQGLSKVISNPKIFTLDNQEAIIFQGTEVPYETVSESGTEVEFKEAGLRLAVTPTIIGDGNLMLNLEVNKDSVDTSQSNPPISKSEIRTNLVTKDSEIVVMGGIYTQMDSKSSDKVPGLGDIPGVGKLFKRDTTGEDRTELIIFIAPRIL